jgi:hypothetical protein
MALVIKNENDKLRIRMELEQDNKKKVEANVALHRHRILNEVIVTKCPHCHLAFSEWDSCFAVEHSIVGSGGEVVAGCQKFW